MVRHLTEQLADRMAEINQRSEAVNERDEDRRKQLAYFVEKLRPQASTGPPLPEESRKKLRDAIVKSEQVFKDFHKLGGR